MTRRDRTSRSTAPTLADRFAVAYLSALVSFITGTLLWLAVAGFNVGGAPIAFLPFGIVIGFTALMAVAGFLLMENVVLHVWVKAWRVLKLLWGPW